MAEIDRINSVKETQGEEAAFSFAERTMKTYRTAVLTSSKRGAGKPHWASSQVWKEKFIRGYLELKRYVIANRPGPKLSFEERMAQAEAMKAQLAAEERARRLAELKANVQAGLKLRMEKLKQPRDKKDPLSFVLEEPERLFVDDDYLDNVCRINGITIEGCGDKVPREQVIVKAPFVVGAVCGNVSMYESDKQCVVDLVMRALTIGAAARKI
jgi:hypothetical protein